jgi:AraC family transcriptional regulator
MREICTTPEHGGRKLAEVRVPGLRVTDAAFPKGAYLPRHTHAGACLSIVYGGGFEEVHDNNSFFLRRGMALFKPAGEAHSDKLASTGSRQYILEYEPCTSWGPLEKLPVIETTITELNGVAHTLAREAAIRDDLSPFALQAAALEAIVVLGRRSAPGQSVAPAWFRRIVSAIDDRVPQRITVQDLAEFGGVHPVYLNRVFRARLGCSASDYLRKKRLQWAAEQLNAGMPISEVAVAAGFCDQSHFVRAFRAHFGITPRIFRDRPAR